MKLTSFPLAIAVFVMLFGGIGLSSALNLWQTESSKEPAKYSSGVAAGEYNPADIRGSYTLGAINEAFGVPVADLQTAFRLPADGNAEDFQIKSLETIYEGMEVEMGTSAVRLFTAFYNGLPYDLAASEESFLFPEAAAILKANGKMTPEQAEYLETHTLSADPLTQAEVPPAEEQINPESSAPQIEEQPAAAPTEHVPTDRFVAGKTTFQNLLDWGLTPESINGLLGEPMPAPSTLIKDYATSKGLEFSTLKSQFQAEVDKQ